MDRRNERGQHLYDATIDQIRLVKVPDFNFLVLDGNGYVDFDVPFLQAALTLFSIDELAKNMLSDEMDLINICESHISPIEALWWQDRKKFDFTNSTKWNWTLMINQPSLMNENILEKTKAKILSKNPAWSFVKLIRLDRFEEGLCVQTSYRGGRKEGKKTLENVLKFIDSNDLKLIGKFHELYFSDPNGLKSEELITIMRLPVSKIKVSQVI